MSSDEERTDSDDTQDDTETSSTTDDSQDAPCLKLKNRNKKKVKKTKAPPTESSATDSTDTDGASSFSNDTPCIRHCLKKQKQKPKQKQHKSKPKQPPPSDTTTTTAASSTDDAETNTTDTETETSEINTTAAEAAGPTVVEAPPDPDWSLSEDALLRGMKTDERSNVTWREIAKALRKSQAACKARWKAIQNLPGATPASNPSGPSNPAPIAAPVKAAKAGTKQDRPKQRQNQNQNQKQKHIQTAPQAQDDAASSLDEEDYTYGFEDLERRRQRRYFHRHILGKLYPPTNCLDPEDFFPQQDCDILAACESRREHVKWLEMQANFYNVTGRMIPLQVIRDKCERGKDRKRIERWAKDVARESQSDS